MEAPPERFFQHAMLWFSMRLAGQCRHFCNYRDKSTSATVGRGIFPELYYAVVRDASVLTERVLHPRRSMKSDSAAGTGKVYCYGAYKTSAEVGLT